MVVFESSQHIVRVIRTKVQSIKVVTNHSIGTCSVDLYILYLFETSGTASCGTTGILRYGNQNEVVLVKVENKDAIEIIPAFDQMARGLSHLLLSYERGTVFLSVRETWKALSVSAQD